MTESDRVPGGNERDTRFASGSVFAERYRLEAPIGEGGAGTIWRATHTALGRPVAIKFIEAIGPRRAELEERFLREARVAAAVRHRNVVDILDFGSDHGQPFMVMEHLVGCTLAARLSDGPLDAATAIDVMTAVLSGLAAVHEAGIVHRDLKPENVFLVDDDGGPHPKLLDFGVSRVVVPTSELRSVLKTRDNVIVGTPQYMAPEQARGVANIDERADLWSAGVVLFELFTGELPFDGDAIGDVLVDIATADVPPLSRLRPELEGPLTELVARAMTRDLDARFESAAAMREALVEIRAQLTPELLASAPEHTRQRSLPLIGGVDVPSSPRAPIRCDPSGRARDETLTLAAPEADAPPRSRAALLGVAVGAALALAAVAFGVALATGAGARDGEDDHAAPAPDVHESASLPAPSTEPPIEETQPSLPPSAEEPEEPRGETVEPSAPRASRRAGRAERRRARPLRDPGY